MDPAYTLAKHILSTKYEDIPADVVEMTKKEILDVLGTALAGSTAAGIKPLAELAKEWGGKPAPLSVMAASCRPSWLLR